MKRLNPTLISALGLSLASSFSASAAQPLEVELYRGETASVNSTIFSDGESLIVMDVQRSTEEAKKLGQQIKAKGLPLTHILITHGHPDHYIGMDHLIKTFPDAKIVVANDAIKQDIIGFSTWMESVGWLDAEPNLKPKSAKHPQGFDYQNRIQVLPSNTLAFAGGNTLTLETQYQPAEAEHVTTVYVDSLNALFMSDLGYNKVHLWMGQGVTNQHIDNWKQQLTEMERQYAPLQPTLYPGHGAPTDAKLFSTMIEYMEYFQAVTADAQTKEAAMDAMKSKYPDYREADFLLKYSVDFHVQP
ncbi:MBL fold metallo-hydrolase [Ferrimonas futtsuensis]|uniref:MBL fold metallo-hydrolase n=1 Tax=Ferrimonas futtsuensis TaxID=364764 RepID=UPI0003FD311A|nr:MBL fold metallo-hydrolase [Ferrimonas futtsuensis]